MSRFVISLLMMLTLSLACCDDGAVEDDGDDANGTPTAQAASMNPETPNTEGDDGGGSDRTLVEVKLDLPEQKIESTPKQQPEDTTARIDAPPDDPIMAPPGATNLALNKKVTSSDADPIFQSLDIITDGVKDSYEGAVIELAFGRQWVQIDLEKPAEIYGIVVWHRHDNINVFRDVIVQVADDEAFTQNVRTLFNNDDDNSSELGAGTDKEYFESNRGKIVHADGETARYVRLWSKGSTESQQNYYVEVEVWGVPAE